MIMTVVAVIISIGTTVLWVVMLSQPRKPTKEVRKYEGDLLTITTEPVPRADQIGGNVLFWLGIIAWIVIVPVGTWLSWKPVAIAAGIGVFLAVAEKFAPSYEVFHTDPTTGKFVFLPEDLVGPFGVILQFLGIGAMVAFGAAVFSIIKHFAV
jgi:hypothetical protein